MKNKKRLYFYKTENPNKINVIFCEKVNYYDEVETQILRDYESKKHRGEWLKLEHGDVAEIKNRINKLTN